MSANSKPSSARSMHSALFFLLFFLALLAWPLAGVVFILPAVLSFDVFWGEAAIQEHLPLFFMVMMLLCSLLVGPFVYLIFWAQVRIRIRLGKIMAGGGWDGAGVQEALQACLAHAGKGQKPVAPEMLKQRRRSLWWQIPVNIALVVASGFLLDALMTPDWVDENKGLAFFGSMTFYGVIIIVPMFYLLMRAGLTSKVVYVPDVVKALAWAGRSSKKMASYGGLGETASFDAGGDAQSARAIGDISEADRMKNLRRNLWWQIPLLLPVALFFIWFSFEPVFLTAIYLLQSREMVQISPVGIVSLFMGAILIVWLMKWWVFASPTAKETSKAFWGGLAKHSGGLFALSIAGCFVVLLPAQFVIMPALDYAQCGALQFSRGSGYPYIRWPSPLTWVKTEKMQAGWCAKGLAWMQEEIKYGPIPYQHVWLHVYERGRARLISPQGQWEITPEQGGLAQNILRYWNLYSWIRAEGGTAYRRLVEEDKRYGEPYDVPKNLARPYLSSSTVWWRHPMDEKGEIVRIRLGFGSSFEKPIESGVLRREYEKIKSEVTTLEALKSRLQVFQFSRDSSYRHYPITDESLDFTGYGCLYAKLLMDEKEDEKGHETRTLKIILQAALSAPENCTKDPALAALEPRLPPPPKPAELFVLPEHGLRQYVWLHVYERGKARMISDWGQWELAPEQGEVAQNILQYWNAYTWRREPAGYDVFNKRNIWNENLAEGEKYSHRRSLLTKSHFYTNWEHPMDRAGWGLTMWRERYTTGASFEQPIYTGVLRRDHEKIKHEIKNPAEAGTRLDVVRFSKPNKFNPHGYPLLTKVWILRATSACIHNCEWMGRGVPCRKSLTSNRSRGATACASIRRWRNGNRVCRPLPSRKS